MTTYYYGRPQVSILEFLITLALVMVLAYAAHCTYANLKFRQKIRRSAVTMNGQLQEWIGK